MDLQVPLLRVALDPTVTFQTNKEMICHKCSEWYWKFAEISTNLLDVAVRHILLYLLSLLLTVM